MEHQDKYCMPVKNPISKIQSVLLLGTNNVLALPVIRSIGSSMPDVSIHTLAYRDNEQAISDLSRYVHTRHYLKSHYGNEELLHFLKHKIQETKADILLPIDEKDVRKISAIKEKLQQLVHLPPLPSPGLFDKLVYKNKLFKLLQELHLPNPQTYYLNDTPLDSIPPTFFPVLFKPIHGSAGTGIKKINTPHQLKILLAHKNHREFIVQEIVPGQKMIFNLLAEEGEILAYNIQEDLESREYSFSTSIKFVKNEQVADQVHKLVEKTSYSGLANIDLMLDERDNQPKIIDFNARFWSSLSGSKAAGLDFTLLACLSALGEQLPKNEEWVTNYGDVYHMGRSTLKYFRNRLKQPFSNSNGHINTDFKERIMDPLPEFVRLIG